MGLFSKYDITLSYASFKIISSFRWVGIKFVSIKFVGRNFNCFLYLELSSQMQRYIKINFKRRFPVQAFAWTLI